MPDAHTIKVDPRDHGQRLDKWLSAMLPDLSRSRIQQLISQSQLTLAGATITNAAAKVKSGETYHLTIPAIIALDLTPVAMPLDIIFEDAHLLIINKPAGLTVHPAAGTHEPTLVHGLLAYCESSLSGIGGVARPGIVHRIDKDTSGLMVVAKTDAAHQHLSAQLKDRSLSREYKAIVWGVPSPPQGTIDAPIGRHPHHRQKMAVVERNSKQARTHYHVEERFGSPAFASLVACKLESGRTHQIRVHLSHIGHPLLADDTYGGTTTAKLNQLPDCFPTETVHFLKNSRRQALHAYKLSLLHPHTHERMEWKAELPDDLLQLLVALQGLA